MMKRHVLLSGIAAAALAMLPATAYAQVENPTGFNEFNESVNIEIEFLNAIDASLDVHVDTDKQETWNIVIDAEGDIDIDAAAFTLNDVKQLLENNYVAEYGHDRDPGNTINDTGRVNAQGNGNIGVNVAAGYYNMQANSAVISAATHHSDGEDEENDTTEGLGGPWFPPNGHPRNHGDPGGKAEANTISLQKLLNNVYCNSCGSPNTVVIGTVQGNGNVGVNAAAGAFNMQENLLSLASVTDSSLAEAAAGVIQASIGNTAVVGVTNNTVSIDSIHGNGNIGVNAAAGIGNVQHNSLTVAAAISNSGGGGGGN